ncbi:MAG: hypothetical protein HUU06_00330 [Planctomycetaceae bacterium]|nr:hypothetical protein [Planctomycetota bacterium]NUN51222.1 hypothetical protein [Planctomycetaceae bacterium]
MPQNRRGGHERFWVCHDPGPNSVIEDVCFETDLRTLAAQVRGGFDPEGRHTNALIYTDPVAARADAEARIFARRAYDAALRAAREGGVVKLDDGGCPVVVHPGSEE